MTLRGLVSKGALGRVTEAQIYYDFENPPWLKYLSAKKYTPGDGLLFGLGESTIIYSLHAAERITNSGKALTPSTKPWCYLADQNP